MKMIRLKPATHKTLSGLKAAWGVKSLDEAVAKACSLVQGVPAEDSTWALARVVNRPPKAAARIDFDAVPGDTLILLGALDELKRRVALTLIPVDGGFDEDAED